MTVLHVEGCTTPLELAVRGNGSVDVIGYLETTMVGVLSCVIVVSYVALLCVVILGVLVLTRRVMQTIALPICHRETLRMTVSLLQTIQLQGS